VSTYGSPYAQVTITSGGDLGQVQPALDLLFQGVMCAKTSAQRTNPAGLDSGGYFCANEVNQGNSRFCKDSTNLNRFKLDSDTKKTELQLGPNGACGKLTYCDEKQACEGKIEVNPL